MKKLLITSVAVCAIGAFAAPAFAGGDMGGMPTKPSASTPDATLTEAEVKKIDATTGMVTLKHGALENIDMPPMTMAYKAKDAAMVQQIHEGDKVKVRVENLNGTLTIVKLVKSS